MQRNFLIVLFVLSFLLALSRQFSSNAFADKRYDFDTDGDLQGWTPTNFEQVEVKGGVVAGKAKFDCQLLSPIFNVEAADYTELVFRAKSDAAGGGEVFFSHPNDGISDKREIVHNLIGDSQFHVYHVNLAAHPEWKGTIVQIRLDLLNPAGAEVALEFVLLKKKPTDPHFAFDVEDDMEGWTSANFEKIEAKGGALVGRTRFDCMIVSPPLSIAAKGYPELIFRARSSLSGSGELFFRHPDDTITEDRQIHHSLIGDGEFHIYRINLAAHPQWKGDIAQIRLDLLNPAGADVALDFIAFKQVPGEILYNGGAELVERGIPVQWTAKGSGATIATDSPRTGDRALRVVCKTAGDSAWIPEPVDLSFLGRFEVTGFTRGATAPRIQIEFTTLGGETLKNDAITQDLPAPGENWQPFRVEFNCPRRAAWAKVSLTNRNVGQVDFDDVNVRQLERGSIVAESNAMPSWNAAWIWHPNTLKEDNTTAYFRKSFRIAAIAPIKTARIQITADDHFRLFVNGREIAHTFGVHDAWRTPLALDIKPFLKDGSNLLAVEANDGTSAQGLLAEATLVFDDGVVTEILTSADWQANTAKDDGWNTNPDSTGDWVAAAVIAHPPSGPWGMVPYEFLGGGATLKAEKFRASVTKNRIRVTAGITPATAVRREVRAEALFSRDGKVVGRRWIPNFSIPVGTTVGSSVPLDTNLPLPYGVSSGPMTMTLSLFGGQWQGTEPTASLTVTVPALPQGFATAKVIPGAAGPQLVVNGKPINPTQTWFITADEMHARNASLAGVKIWSVEVDDMGWKAPEKYDYSAIDAKLQALLDVDPDVWFIITYDLSTRFQPWWIEAHPEALCRMESNDETIGDYAGSRRKVPSFASSTWREAFLDCQARLVRHLKESPFASRIIGYEPCNGITYEWFLWGAQSNELVDYSESGIADFRRWLKEKYETDAALQAAWEKPAVTLATAAIPTDKERRSPASGMFFTPGAQQNVIDYNRHQHDQVVDTILYFAKGLKKASEGKGIVGTFYGYVSHLPDSPGFGQSSGHFQLSRMLQEPDIDFLMSPTAYSWRELGGTSACMTAFGALSLNNKIWFNQADTRTHWSHQDGFGRSTDLTGSIQVQRREEVLALTTGCVVQWFDFSAGWMWGDVRLAEDAKRLSEIDAACRSRRPLPRKDVLAVIVDDQQMGRSDLFKLPYADHLIYRQRNFLHQCGVPWTMYLFSDLVKHPELKEHRAFLFLNLFTVDEAKRKVIEDLKSNGRVLAFVGPAGFVGDDFSVERASKLIGINLQQLDAASARALACRISNPESPLVKGLTKESIYGVALKPEPAFAISDAASETVGSYDGSDLPCLATRRYPKWTSVSSLTPGLPPEVLRGIARLAGLNVYSDANNPIFIGHGLVGIHAASSGEKLVRLPAAATVKELFSGTTLKGKVTEIRWKMKAGETALFQVDP